MNLPAKQQQTEPKSKEKTLFRAPKPGEVTYLLVPSDTAEYERVLEHLSKLGIDDQLPKLRKEIDLSKLGSKHVVYTAMCRATKIDPVRKQTLAWELVVSAPVAVEAFTTDVDGDDETFEEGLFVDELNKAVRPMRVSISNDRSIKLMLM